VSLVTSAAALLLGQAARSMAMLARLGRRSLDIYLAHIIMASGTRIVLLHLGVTSTWVIVICCLLAGVIGSLVVAGGLRRIGLGWIFDGPGRLRWRDQVGVRWGKGIRLTGFQG
jgi:peptidoglycan/LPS O-acetylase OafA/YrhL